MVWYLVSKSEYNQQANAVCPETPEIESRPLLQIL